MTKKILLVLAVGILLGLFVLPDSVYDSTGLMLDIGLCLLLFFVGIDKDGNNIVIYDLTGSIYFHLIHLT